MSRWKIKTPALLILVGVIFLMLLIVVLPDVDLPDIAFHGGTAPVVVHAHATRAPNSVNIAVASPTPNLDHALRFQLPGWASSASIPPNFRPILLRSIRC
ncbi:MAG TPA: hypothetical protein VGS78_05365 [Candidatus Sulfotelmatobacter sp.]|nr:hypothetical protein [Candidatus Sulfotelmatobacter sp.]